jgi:hypothetical protein
MCSIFGEWKLFTTRLSLANDSMLMQKRARRTEGNGCKAIQLFDLALSLAPQNPSLSEFLSMSKARSRLNLESLMSRTLLFEITSRKEKYRLKTWNLTLVWVNSKVKAWKFSIKNGFSIDFDSRDKNSRATVELSLSSVFSSESSECLFYIRHKWKMHCLTIW